MDQMQQRFINAVTSSLSAAPESSAKAEVIEELSDNLYQRYLDMTAAGMPQGEAFERALDDLGDTEELVSYLRSLAPEEELPELTLHPDIFETLADDAVKAARDALAGAADVLRNLKETHWRSSDGTFELHLDGYDDDHGEHPRGEDHEDQEPQTYITVESRDTAAGKKKKDIIYGFGYDKAKGGFFTQWGEWKGAGSTEAPAGEAEDLGYGDMDNTIIPSNGLRGIDIQILNGDINIRLNRDPDENAPILLENRKGLEIRRTQDNILAIRQENTASSSFFFRRGLSSADVELSIPRRFWEFIQCSVTNGDVTIEDKPELGRLSVKTACGDLEADCSVCGDFSFKSASGDCNASGLTGTARAETMSGDLCLHGALEQVSAHSMSGDISFGGSFNEGHFASMSGDLDVKTHVLPSVMELSNKSGDCSARLPADKGFTLHYKTTSGSFDSRFPLKRTSRGAVYLDGGDRTFSMTSLSGDLWLGKC